MPLAETDMMLVIAGFVLLMLGGEFVVQGAVTIANRLRVPPLLVGFTVVAIGTAAGTCSGFGGGWK